MSTPSSLEASYILVEGEQRPAPPSFPLVQEPPAPVHVEKPEIPTEHPSNDASYRPGQTPYYAHDWSPEATGGLRLHGRHFIDAYGRVCNLRGVNLSGSCKTPIDHDHQNFPGDHRSVTFVGRPFPLEEADEHFARLRRWGLTFIRFLVTWEAIEHAGPGIYDKDYLTYLRELLSLLPKFGLSAFVSIHQDVWSRYTGGSGAPAWTLELAGLDLHAIEHSGAAWLLGMRGGGHTEAERGLWPCGYQKLAAATMATCFWGGDTFAPKLFVKDKEGKDISIQQFLQSAFLSAFDELARAVGDLPGVIGFQMMNEPHRGYIQIPSLHAFDYNTDLHLSHVPSAFQSFQLGAGHPTTVATWSRSFPMPTKKSGETLLNAEGRKAWRDDGPTQGKCLWEIHDVWGWDRNKNQAVALRENYFRKHPSTGKEVDWYTDFYYPFVKKWSERIHAITSKDKIIFVEPIPNEFCPTSWTPERRPANMVFAPHWYDLHALFEKAFGDFSVNVQGLSRGMFPLKAFYWGQKGVRDNYALQIRNIVEHGYKALGETPAFIGECGIPMDMNHKEAFRTDDFTWQARMMDALVTALDRALVGFTLWNYNPYNDDERGDDWNGENFSWFSKKRALPRFLLYFEQTAPSLDQGGRILTSLVRPYPAKTAGIPLKFEYEVTTGTFVFEWVNPGKALEGQGGPSVHTPPLSGHPELKSWETEIFVPSRLTLGRKLVVEGLGEGESYLHDESRQTLFILSRDDEPGKVHRVQVSVRPGVKPEFEVNDFRSDYGGHVFASGMVLIAILVVVLLRVFGIDNTA